MNEAQRILNDMFNSYKQTSSFKDGAMMEIMLRRQEFEQHLDKMWQTYISGNLRQVVEYKNKFNPLRMLA